MNPNANKTDLEQLRYLVRNTKVPLLIKNTFRSELLNWDIQKWQDVLGNEKLPFRRGKNICTLEPQFENSTEIIHQTFKELIEVSDSNKWYYFDYKYLEEWFCNIPEFRKHISWEAFGYPELQANDSTIWIGSKNAHTPCHADTYGCNIVAQVYGRKRWILFPPNENLLSTRIPYEESSIYSKLNLFAPRISDFQSVDHARSIVLNPGDVLILPHRWWHYVENLEFAISINTWIQLPIDHEERIQEAIAQMLISQIIGGLDANLQSKILNPSDNQEILTDNIDALNSVKTILLCLKSYKEQTLPESELVCIDDVIQKCKNIQEIEEMSREDFVKLLENQRNRFPCTDDLEVNEAKDDSIKKVIDAVVHSDVIHLIKKKLIEDG